MSGTNQAWDLKSFVEALTAELDRAQDMLRIKAMNRPLTYTVQDVSLSLNVFAQYDGDEVRFRTAQPNEEGASTLDLKLGSITDRVVEQTTPPPPKSDDILIEDLPDIDEHTRKSLDNLGIRQAKQVMRLGRDKVKVNLGDRGEVDFARLANLMHQARTPRPPRISRVVSYDTPTGPTLRLFGDDLELIAAGTAHFNGQAVEASVGPHFTDITLPEGETSGELTLETTSGEQVRLRLLE